MAAKKTAAKKANLMKVEGPALLEECLKTASSALESPTSLEECLKTASSALEGWFKEQREEEIRREAEIRGQEELRKAKEAEEKLKAEKEREGGLRQPGKGKSGLVSLDKKPSFLRKHSSGIKYGASSVLIGLAAVGVSLLVDYYGARKGEYPIVIDNTSRSGAGYTAPGSRFKANQGRSQDAIYSLIDESLRKLEESIRNRHYSNAVDSLQSLENQLDRAKGLPEPNAVKVRNYERKMEYYDNKLLEAAKKLDRKLTRRTNEIEEIIRAGSFGGEELPLTRELEEIIRQYRHNPLLGRYIEK